MKKRRRYATALLLFLLMLFFTAPMLVDRFANRTTQRDLPEVTGNARELHRKLWIADLHSDALLWNRDPMQRHTRGHVDLPRLIDGNVALQFFTAVTKVPFGLNFQENSGDSDMITLLAIAQRWPMRTWNSLLQRALYQADRLKKAEQQSAGTFTVITSRQKFSAYLNRRAAVPAISAGILGLEGAQVLESSLANVAVLFAAGYRMMAPTHFFDTEVSGSAHGVGKGGLTPFGRQAIRLMEQLGMIVDLAHASPAAIDDVLAMATKPVFVSHTGVKATCDNIRNLSDRQLRAIAAGGGIVGIAYFDQATCGEDAAAIVRGIQHTVRVAGVEHVALGSDFDGLVATPFATDRLDVLTQGLLDAGFSGSEVALIMGGNVRRLLLQLLPLD